MRIMCVKAPMFSFIPIEIINRLRLRCHEMASTGEVACFGDDIHDALNFMIATGFKLPKRFKNIYQIGGEQNSIYLVES